MTQTFRTDDLGRWGSGKGSKLTPTEVDINFWDLIQRLLTLEALPDAAAGIDHFSISGTDLYVHMTDATVLGPYTLPYATFNARGEWAVATFYSVLDTFTINGGLYVVIFDHTSDATSFDPGDNDGMGHDYYALMIQTPGSALPTGGAVAQVLEKSTTSDYAVTWGYKLPTGGTTRQYLIKQSNTNQDADWETSQAEDIEFTPVTGSLITSDNLADVVEELSSGTAIEASGIPFTPTTGSGLASSNVEDAINEVAEAGASAGSLVGRHTIWMPAASMTPTLTNGASLGLVELASNDIMLRTLDFDSTTAEYAQFEIAMPKSWDRDSFYFKVFWSHASTTTNFGVMWELNCVCISNDDAMDTSLPFGASMSDTGGTTNDLYITDESGALSVSATEGDLLIFKINRDPTDGDDTLAVDARLQGVQIIYVTNAATDDEV